MNQLDGFQRRRELKKSHILQAALALFMEFGIQKVSIKEIAAKANVSQVTIYNYFGGKDQLVHDVIAFYINQELKRYEQIIYSDQPFQEKMRAIVFAKTDTSKQINDNFFQTMMREYKNDNSYIQEVYVNKALPMTMDLFNEGKKQGYIDPQLSNQSLLMYLQIFQEAMQREDIYQQILPLTEDIIKLFFYGIVGKDGREGT